MLIQPTFTDKDIEILEKTSLYQGHLKLLKYKLRYRLFRGGWSVPLIRECFQSHHAAGVLLFDPHRDEIILVEEFRLGALEKTGSPWLLEIVAGIIEPDETLEDVARRESQEEAGCEVLDLMPVCEYWTSPGISTGKFTLFCAKIDTASYQPGIFGLIHEHEDIRTHVLPKSFVYNAVKTGEIKNASTLIALQWLMLNEEEVKKKWL